MRESERKLVAANNSDKKYFHLKQFLFQIESIILDHYGFWRVSLHVTLNMFTFWVYLEIQVEPF